MSALGAWVTWASINAWITGEPLEGRFGMPVPAWFSLTVGLFLFFFPAWHLPQLRKENTLLPARITATPSGLEVTGKTGEYERYFLPWETIRGFRVEKGRARHRRKDLLVASLAGNPAGAATRTKGSRARWNPLAAVRTDAAAVTDISCTEPHATARALNYLLGSAALRAELGSARSEAAVSSAQAGTVPRTRA